jgi:hypothetical protein
MKFENGNEIGNFSDELALALSEKFHIKEWVSVPKMGMTTEYVEVSNISDFIQKFIGEHL